MREPLRILHLIDKNQMSTGSVVQMMAAARGLAGNGHNVWVGSRTGGDLEGDCRASGLPFLGLPFRGLLDPASAWVLRQHLKQHRIEVLHVHKGLAHAVGLVASAGLGYRPRVVVNRGVSFPLDFWNKWKYRHRRVGAIVCVADAVARVVIQSAGVDRNRVHIVYGATDCAEFDPLATDGASLRLELGFEREQVVVGQVSVRDWKGWSDLVSAFSKVSPRAPHARLLMIGCEPVGERLAAEALALRCGIAERVVTMPFRRDMPRVLAACDIVVDASWAGTGITGTIREAMAMGRAVVATDCGGNRELIADGTVGILVPPRDIDSLAGAVSRLIEDPFLRQRLGMAARQRVVDLFSTERRIERLESLYREILE